MGVGCAVEHDRAPQPFPPSLPRGIPDIPGVKAAGLWPVAGDRRQTTRNMAAC